ncbi:MAG TPA: hypothetical protein VN493_13800 [Thermoanaerobaculia bacterium]|nr:hypothetical protein [Thermoanaerobaculia bacterium]
MNREKEAEERNRLDERWDRLSSGNLSSEEAAELRAMAEASEEVREAYEAFRPLGPEFHAGVMRAIREQALAEGAESAAPKPPVKLLPFPVFRFAGWSAAAAAVLVLFLRPPVPLPDYSMKVSGGSSAMRGEPEEMVTDFAPGDRFQVNFIPKTAASGGKRLEALSFLSQGHEPRRLAVRSELDPGGGGAVRIKGSLDHDLRPGTWTLWAVVGRPGKLPDPADLAPLTAKSQVRQRDWVAIPQEIRILPGGSRP